MAPSDILAAFIGSSFPSVWALELLLLLKREKRACSHDELVTSLRASPAVVDKALRTLVAAGLAGFDGHAFSYMPVSQDAAALVDQTEQLYRSHPDRVRRLIVISANKSLAAFSDAFRLKD